MHKISPALFVTVCWMLSGACFGASPSPEARLAAQNRLFEEFYQFELRVHPERATAYGDYRYNDRLDEYSLAALKSQHAQRPRVSSRAWREFRPTAFPSRMLYLTRFCAAHCGSASQIMASRNMRCRSTRWKVRICAWPICRSRFLSSR